VARLRAEAEAGDPALHPLQRRVGPRVLVGLGEALRSHGRLHERLVGDLGVAFTDLRMSTDLRKAFVQWTAFSGAEQRAGRELGAAAGLLRRKLRRLGLKHTPELVFRSGRMTVEQARVEEAFARIHAEGLDGGPEEGKGPVGGGEGEEGEGLGLGQGR